MTKKKQKHKKAFKRALANDLDAGNFETTLDDVMRWFTHLNRAVFDEKVPEPVFEIKRIRYKGWAAAYENCYKITLRERYASERAMLETIAHEMVHLIQYEDTDDMNHGPYFQRWKEHFKKLDIKL